MWIPVGRTNWKAIYRHVLLYDMQGKAIPLQALTGPEGSRRLRLPNFKTIGTTLSAQRTGRLYPQEIFLELISVTRLSRPQGHNATGRIMSMKNFNDTIGYRSRYLRFVAQCLIHCWLNDTRLYLSDSYRLCVCVCVCSRLSVLLRLSG
jgi:hypothetical protein